jgi:GNAT superfamily N-acetyltransferase
MGHEITSVTEVADRPALDALLREYYAVVLAKLAAAGGPRHYRPEDLAASFWTALPKVLPPAGRLLLVHDEAGRLVGCGTLQQARADAGELKRLYVRPEANGHGLGRKLVDARIDAARAMGWRTLLVNAIRGNQDMLRIYEKIGFRYIDRYPECSDPAEIADFFIYMQRDL